MEKVMIDKNLLSWLTFKMNENKIVDFFPLPPIFIHKYQLTSTNVKYLVKKNICHDTENYGFFRIRIYLIIREE